MFLIIAATIVAHVANAAQKSFSQSKFSLNFKYDELPANDTPFAFGKNYLNQVLTLDMQTVASMLNAKLLYSGLPGANNKLYTSKRTEQEEKREQGSAVDRYFSTLDRIAKAIVFARFRAESSEDARRKLDSLSPNFNRLEIFVGKPNGFLSQRLACIELIIPKFPIVADEFKSDLLEHYVNTELQWTKIVALFEQARTSSKPSGTLQSLEVVLANRIIEKYGLERLLSLYDTSGKLPEFSRLSALKPGKYILPKLPSISNLISIRYEPAKLRLCTFVSSVLAEEIAFEFQLLMASGTLLELQKGQVFISTDDPEKISALCSLVGACLKLNLDIPPISISSDDYSYLIAHFDGHKQVINLNDEFLNTIDSHLHNRDDIKLFYWK